MAEPFPEFLIEGILPSEEVHLLAGPSGAGKTTVLLNIIAQWQDGLSIFGHKSHPLPYAYISCDRSRKSVTATLTRLGLQNSITRILCRLDLPKPLTLAAVLKAAVTKYPDALVFFIEGFQLLPTQGNEYRSTGVWLSEVTGMCEQKHYTIIGVAHSPKRREDAAIVHPRESVLGSVAWAAYSDTVIYLDINENDRSRYMQIMPRNAPEEEHSFVLGDKGRIVWIAEDDANVLETRLMDRLPGSKITREQATSIATASSLSERTAERVLSKMVAAGELFRVGRGQYVRASKDNVIEADFKVAN